MQLRYDSELDDEDDGECFTKRQFTAIKLKVSNNFETSLKIKGPMQLMET